MADHNTVVKALAVVCEITGTVLSDAAQKVIIRQLATYDPAMVVKALERCAQECKYRLTLADILTRLDDGRPGAEEAWAMFPKTEEQAGTVTVEMSVAWGAASALFAEDPIAARMAFKETYDREVRQARAENRPVHWRISPGFDKASNEAAAKEAYGRGLVSRRAAEEYILPEKLDGGLLLPAPEAKKRLKDILGKLLGDGNTGDTGGAP